MGGLRSGSVLAAGLAFAAGLLAGATLSPHARGRTAPLAVPPPAVQQTAGVEPGSEMRAAQPAQVLRVIDGDTFEARVRVWPGLDITTKVRLRGIDAPELGTRCAAELAKAEAARSALAAILSEGAVSVMRVAPDKYGGRVLADASTRKTSDIAAALLEAGHVRRYSGGRRDGWC
jgi:endonuclease YncB( thermonuclease family)